MASICATKAGGVLSVSNGPPGRTCIVTKVIPVTNKKTGIDQKIRRSMTANMGYMVRRYSWKQR